MSAIEGRLVCDARASACRCFKDADHVAAGDPTHACDQNRCTGQWQGEYGESTFRVVILPFSVAEPVPWDTP